MLRKESDNIKVKIRFVIFYVGKIYHFSIFDLLFKRIDKNNQSPA